MCIGIPMQVMVDGPLGAAWCDDGDEHHKVDMLVVGPQVPGTWVLVHAGTAREVLGETRARQIQDALAALSAVAAGEPVDRFFADLVGREPQLPEFLRKT